MTDEQYRQLRQQLEMRDRQLAAVHRISAAVFSTRDLDTLLRETLHIALATVDADAGSILLFDEEKRRLVFRYVIGKTELIGQEIDPETSTGHAAAVFLTGEPRITGNTQTEGYDDRFDRDTGYLTLNMLTAPLKTLGGATIGVMQVLNKRTGIFDINDLALLEIVCSFAATSIVNSSLAEEAQLAAVARAVNDLAHDIKNGLNLVKTPIETLFFSLIRPMYEELDAAMLEWTPAHPEIVARLQSITSELRDFGDEVRGMVEDGCTDIEEMCRQIADYIKGTENVHITPDSLDEVIRPKLQRLAKVAANSNVTVLIEGTEDVPPFPFDRRLVGRAVWNLVDNARKAISDAVRKRELDYRRFTVRVRATAVPRGSFPQGNYCLIEVQDDGPGIPAHVLKTLFTDHTLSTTPGGTGIGTRFVKRVADQHGGQVGVESHSGSGSRFWIKFPLQPEG